MNMEELLAAVLEGKPWMERFTRTGYEPAFCEYKARFGPVYVSALQDAGEKGIPALAASLLDGMEAAWAHVRPWKRTMARLNTQQMLVQYLTPMLLTLGPESRKLAECLRDAWAARWPKEAYQLAAREELQGGFRRTVFGIPVPDGLGGSENRS